MRMRAQVPQPRRGAMRVLMRVLMRLLMRVLVRVTVAAPPGTQESHIASMPAGTRCSIPETTSPAHLQQGRRRGMIGACRSP
jgi:hypothetical protein